MKHSALLLPCAALLLMVPSLAHADEPAPEVEAAEDASSWSQSASVEADADDLPQLEPDTEPDAESDSDEGRGWFIGADIGLGGVAASYSDGGDRGAGAGVLHLRLGGIIRPRLSVSVEFWSDGYNDKIEFAPDERFVQNTVAVALNYWASSRIWVTGGLGAASLHDYSTSIKVSNDGVAYMVGLGLEAWRWRNYSLDLTFRLINSSYDVGFDRMSRTTAGFGVGATWH